jgi:predicted nucleic acid-binding protein
VNVLFDTNVVIDFLLDREPHVDAATALVARVERGTLRGYLCATTITTVFYLTEKQLGSNSAHAAVKQLLGLFEVAPVSRIVLESALDAKFHDFEDAVIHQAAKGVQADCIVTRNGKDFKQATLPVHTPAELEALLVSISE